MSDDVQVQTKGLDQFIKAFKGKLPTVRVGILGSNNSRNDGSNAAIGAIHEFGDSTHPMRSFLRVPIAENLDKYLDSHQAFDEDNIKKIVRDGKITVWMEQIGVVAEMVVADAFTSGGFGKWAPWKNGYTSKTGNILVDTTQLRGSITSEVKDG